MKQELLSKMTIDKFGKHINQQKTSFEENEHLTSTNIAEDIVRDMYYNAHLTFQSNIFQEGTKQYLLSNIKTCHTSFFEYAVVEHVVGYPTDIITIVNDMEFLELKDLLNLPLKRGDRISFREKDPESTNSNLLIEFFIRIPVGIGNPSI